MTRTHRKRRRDREAARETLLNRCRRIANALSNIPTGDDAWTVDQHRATGIALPVGFDPVEVQWFRFQLAGYEGPMPPWVEEARRDRDRRTPRERSRAPSSTMVDSLPESYGVDPCDRITHQRIADQASKAISALESCGHWRGVYSCPEHGKWASTSRCGHRLCVPCAVHRRHELLGKYAPWFTRMQGDEKRVPMLTLTQRSIANEGLDQAFDRLTTRHRAFTRAVLRELPGTCETSKAAKKQAKEERRHIGGLSNFEATPRKDKDGARRWNAHAHVLLREPDHVPDEWSVPGWNARPINPWRFRLLWASALLDGRKAADALKIRKLTRLYLDGRDAWREKMRAAGDKLPERRAETLILRKWAALCDRLDVPAICDLRWVHPAEGIKYVSKGFDIDGSWIEYRDQKGRKRWKKGAPVTDWHLWQLLVGTYYLRRTIPWGSLYRLPKEKPPDTVYVDPHPDQVAAWIADGFDVFAESGAQIVGIASGLAVMQTGATATIASLGEISIRDTHKACPYCKARSAPVPRSQWSGAVADTVLIAFKLDRQPYRPRGSPIQRSQARSTPTLDFPGDPGDQVLQSVLGDRLVPQVAV